MKWKLMASTAAPVANSGTYSIKFEEMAKRYKAWGEVFESSLRERFQAICLLNDLHEA